MPLRRWKRDLPDLRDFTADHPHVRAAFQQLAHNTEGLRLPSRVDLAEHFSAVARDDHLASSTISAAIALLEYFQRRVSGETSLHSRLFAECVAHQICGAPVPCDLDLRSALKTLVRFGAPPARVCTTSLMQTGQDPMPFHFGYADSFAEARYLRMATGQQKKQTLRRLRAFLAAGFPVAFGFSVPEPYAGQEDIPFRPTYDSAPEGTAAVAIGYDDKRIRTTPGAIKVLLFGTEAGECRMAWLPYRYVEYELAVDFWTAYSERWLATGEFSRPDVPEFAQQPLAGFG